MHAAFVVSTLRVSALLRHMPRQPNKAVCRQVEET